MTHNINKRDEETLRIKLIDFAQSLKKEGFVVRTWGNMSLRLSEDLMLITPTGKSYDELQPDELVKMEISSGKLKGENLYKPSSEAPMHRAYYLMHHKAKAAVHTHQGIASALSLAGTSFNLSGNDRYISGTTVLPTALYGLPGTRRLHNNVRKVIQETGAETVLMEKHGVLSGGCSIEEAGIRIANLEDYARRQYIRITGEIPFERESLYADYEDEYSAAVSKTGESSIISKDPLITEVGQNPILPWLDDFAQFCGIRAGSKRGKSEVIISEDGNLAICFGKDEAEARQVRMVFEKNLKAWKIAEAYGKKPLNTLHAYLMRTIYLKSYSSKAGA